MLDLNGDQMTRLSSLKLAKRYNCEAAAQEIRQHGHNIHCAGTDLPQNCQGYARSDSPGPEYLSKAAAMLAEIHHLRSANMAHALANGFDKQPRGTNRMAVIAARGEIVPLYDLRPIFPRVIAA